MIYQGVSYETSKSNPHFAPWPAKVVKVSDGDTVWVIDEQRQQIKLRLYGIDAPEMDQPYGFESGERLAQMIYQRQITVVPIDYDQYGRLVAMIEFEEININGELIKEGLAWVYHQYCGQSICRKWQQWENVAKKEKLNLWADINPVPPWIWRRK
ncbi:MAG: thermonuclease family protein [Candidatus Adiutrix sp.]